MKKMHIRLIAAALASVMVLSLMACNDSEREDESENTSESIYKNEETTSEVTMNEVDTTEEPSNESTSIEDASSEEIKESESVTT